jgi:hypothetical protein
MSKSVIATLSIGSLLFLASIANARLTHQSAHQSQPSLIAKQSDSKPKSPTHNISDSDLTGIQQAIAERYLNKNQILENSASKSRRFYEVKSLRLTSFSDKKARVEIEEDIRNYDLIGMNSADREKRSFQKAPGSEYIKHVFNINLEKSVGKWKINNRSTK